MLKNKKAKHHALEKELWGRLSELNWICYLKWNKEKQKIKNKKLKTKTV